jgi:transposase-like protein
MTAQAWELLESTRTHRSYAPEEKLRIIDEYLDAKERGKPISTYSLAKKHKVQNEANIRAWLKQEDKIRKQVTESATEEPAGTGNSNDQPQESVIECREELLLAAFKDIYDILLAAEEDRVNLRRRCDSLYEHIDKLTFGPFDKLRLWRDLEDIKTLADTRILDLLRIRDERLNHFLSQ